MKIVRLDESHKTLFFEFIETEIARRNLQNNPMWSNIDWINDSRDIWAAFDEDKIQMTLAVNSMPIRNMPWKYLDTQVSSPKDFVKSSKIITKIFKTIFEYYEKEQGIWGWWTVSDARKIKLHFAKERNNTILKDKIGRYGSIFLDLIQDDFYLCDAALIKKGCKSGIPLYDTLLGSEPSSDTLIRFFVKKYQYMRDNIPTYG